MAFQVSPGVNVSEIDLTTVVPQVSTNIGAIAGHFRWGPVEQRALMSSEDTLVQTFQKPNANTKNDFFTAANFLAYTNALQVVRVVNQAAGASQAVNANGGSNTTVLIKNDEEYENTYESSGVTSAGNWVARFPGELGNSLKVSVCASANAYESTITVPYTATRNSKTVALNAPGVGAVASNAAVNFTVGDLLVLGPDKEVRKIASLGSGSTSNTITLDSAYTGNTSTITSGLQRRWEFFNNFDRAPGTSPFAANTAGTNDEAHIVVSDEDGDWTGARNTILERFEKLSKASDAKSPQGQNIYYKDYVNEYSNYVKWADHFLSGSIGSKAKGTAFGGGNGKPENDSFAGGRDGALPRDADYIAGYDLFKNAEDVDINIVLGAAANQTRALDLINNVAETRKDCVVTISPEEADVVNNSGYTGKEADDVVAYRNSLPSSSFAIIDSGWKYQYDKYNDVYRYVPLNGDTAGTMARTDQVRDPWYSPAGLNRGRIKNVVKLAFNPRQAQRDLLYKNGINPVVAFPGQGTILFGDKTMLATPSAFYRINVRRLFIVLEKSIAIAARASLFEFNDTFTRLQFRNLIEPFLREVQGRRGITDFKVICDETNNTGEVVDRNEFVGDIFIKPARSINFIQLNFVAVRSGVEFSEVVGAV